MRLFNILKALELHFSALTSTKCTKNEMVQQIVASQSVDNKTDKHKK